MRRIAGVFATSHDERLTVKSAMKRVRVWDLPTRLFHWAVAGCFIGLVVTGKVGGPAMVWHFQCAYVMTALLLFRVVWGLVGGHWSRFSSFAYPLHAVADYVRKRGSAEHAIGHNPLGALSVFAMLFFLLAQVGTGLFSENKEDAFGPLSRFVSDATVRLMTAYHKSAGQFALLLLVTLHLLAVCYYHFYRKENLLGPMIHGDKILPNAAQSTLDNGHSRAIAVAIFAVCAGLVAFLVQLAG
jgi:cytochrome b